MAGKRFGKIGVLAGGPSNERAISLRSGKAVYDALVAQGLDVILVDVKDDVQSTIAQTNMDVAFIALHGRFGEDGTVQKMLEAAGIPYTGSGVSASRTAIDKVAAKKIFTQKGIPTPRYAEVGPGGELGGHVKRLGLPLIVKPQFEGSSIGLTVVRKEGELEEAVARALSYEGKALIEEYIDGRELTVGILADEPLPVIEIVTKDGVYDYSAKYSDPQTRYLAPAPLDKDISKKAQEIGKSAHVGLGCRSFSRVDMIMDKNSDMFVLEVNTIPGMTERSLLPKAASVMGLDFNRLCVKLLEEALRKDGKD